MDREKRASEGGCARGVNLFGLGHGPEKDDTRLFLATRLRQQPPSVYDGVL